MFSIHKRFYFQFIEKLREDYRRVSIASIFVEQMRVEEEESSFSPSFTAHFRLIESQIYPLLCQLKVAILGKGEQLPFISSSAINHSLRNTETHAQRHMRDYRILKEFVRLFRAIQSDYENIETHDINQPVDDRWDTFEIKLHNIKFIIKHFSWKNKVVGKTTFTPSPDNFRGSPNKPDGFIHSGSFVAIVATETSRLFLQTLVPREGMRAESFLLAIINVTNMKNVLGHENIHL